MSGGAETAERALVRLFAGVGSGVYCQARLVGGAVTAVGALAKGLLDRDSFASQLATQMQMERLHPKIEMLFAIWYCRVRASTHKRLNHGGII